MVIVVYLPTNVATRLVSSTREKIAAIVPLTVVVRQDKSVTRVLAKRRIQDQSVAMGGAILEKIVVLVPKIASVQLVVFARTKNAYYQDQNVAMAGAIQARHATLVPKIVRARLDDLAMMVPVLCPPKIAATKCVKQPREKIA